MSPATYILVGKITAPHGIKGYVKLQSYMQVAGDIVSYPLLYSSDGLKSYRIKKQGQIKDQLIVSLEGCTDRNCAELMRNTPFYVPRDAFKSVQDDDSFYISDLIGCVVHNQQAQTLGLVVDVHNFGAGDIVEIAPAENATFMAAFTHANFPVIDTEQRVLVYVPPEIIGAKP